MSELRPGDVLGGCRVEAVIGRGGMGVVYKALQLDLRRPVALKVIAADRAGDVEFRGRFERESLMAAAIDHPNIVPVYAAGEEDGALFLVMRFVPGSDLHAVIRRDQRLPPARAAEIVAQLGSALDVAHAAGLVHRDVKPANVLLAGNEDHAYLSDFGLTRKIDPQHPITDSGQWLGTVDFASPEQLSGGSVDARSDVYSLGCVLHAALTGSAPFPRGTVPATLLAHLHDAPPRPSASGAPAHFDRVMARALAKAPEDRYPSAGDLGRAALAAARGEAVTESERTVAIGPAAPQPATRRIEPPLPPCRRGPRRPRSRHRSSHPETPHAALGARRRGAGPARRDRHRRGAHARRRRRQQHGGGANRPARRGRGPRGRGGIRRGLRDRGRRGAAPPADRRRRARAARRRRPRPRRGRPPVRDAVSRQRHAELRARRARRTGGRAGRAGGAYLVRRAGGESIRGRIVFGVVRDRGRTLIALIAVTPRA